MFRKRYLKGGQAKLDANKDGKITAEDFKLLKSKKKKNKKPSPMMLAMRDKRNMGASRALEEQLKQAKKEDKVEDKTNPFLRKKTRGEKINKLLKKAAYGDN